jgi:hypothetical protein
MRFVISVSFRLESTGLCRAIGPASRWGSEADYFLAAYGPKILHPLAGLCDLDLYGKAGACCHTEIVPSTETLRSKTVNLPVGGAFRRILKKQRNLPRSPVLLQKFDEQQVCCSGKQRKKRGQLGHDLNLLRILRSSQDEFIAFKHVDQAGIALDQRSAEFPIPTRRTRPSRFFWLFPLRVFPRRWRAGSCFS